MTFDAATFRNTLGCFASGVTVVTAADADGTPVGVTVSAFSSLSLDPPLVLFCLDRKTSHLDVFRTSGHFAVHVLAENQRDVSARFAKRGDDKWDGQDFSRGNNGSPLLPGCLASMECTTTAIHEGGDHLVFVGQVDRASASDTGKPLLYFRGNYAALARLVTAS